MGQRTLLLIIGIVTMLNTWDCIAGSIPKGRKEQEEHHASPMLAALWEEKRGDQYINRGVSQLEKVGSRYLLTTFCDGVHSVYAEGSDEGMLDKYLGTFVRVHYLYILKENSNIRCVQAPCAPMTERVALITNIEQVSVSEAERLSYQRICTADVPH